MATGLLPLNTQPNSYRATHYIKFQRRLICQVHSGRAWWSYRLTLWPDSQVDRSGFSSPRADLWLPSVRQHHEVPGVKAEVQGEPAALRRHGRDRAVLGGPPRHAVPHQEPAVQASAHSLQTLLHNPATKRLNVRVDDT